MEQIELLELAAATFADRLALVGDDQWDAPTPCEGWNARDLVHHVVGGNAMAVALLDGVSTEDAIAVFTGTNLADDVAAEYAAGAAAQTAALRGDRALGTVVHHPMGDLPGGVLLGFRIGDLTIHSWDLARAIGAEETLPEPLVEATWANLSPMAEFIGTVGVFGEGPSGSAFAGAPLQERLLDLAGRRP
jgi:uncharacterized protein (TIGR03086 family)